MERATPTTSATAPGSAAAARTTALRQFARLETIGLWRPAPGAQRREVVVSFGEATMVIAEGSGRPLTHWSLPAVKRLNPGEEPALYSPDGDPGEVLEIDDPLMIEALEKVRGAIAGARPHPGLLRRGGTWAVMGAFALAATLWLPGAIKRQTLSLVPETTRQEIGATVLGLMQRETGPACRAEAGVAALSRLAARLYGPDVRVSLVVLPGDMSGPVRLPGGIVAIPRASLASTDDPYVLAGDVLAAMAATSGTDPLRAALDTAGLRATLTLIATGTLPAAAVEPLAHRLLAQAPRTGDVATLTAVFAAADLPVAPWAQDRRPTEAEVLIAAQIEAGGADAALPAEHAPVMTDADWVGLQAICAG